jgi:hypothetical protein
MDLDEYEVGGRWGQYLVRNVGHMFGKNPLGLVGPAPVHENSKSTGRKGDQDDKLVRGEGSADGQEEKKLTLPNEWPVSYPSSGSM